MTHYREITLCALIVLLLAACGPATPDPTATADASVVRITATLDSEIAITDTPVPEATATPEPDAPRAPDPLVLYDFEEGGGASITDRTGGGLDMIVATLDTVTWVEGGLRIDLPTLIASINTAGDLTAALQASGQISIEAWIEPANTTQSGPARIVTLSGDRNNRNLTLGQGVHNSDGDFFEVRLRTSATDDNGRPSLLSESGTLSATLMYVVYTFDGVSARLYVDGEEIVSGSEMAGDFSNWNADYRLALGDEFTQDRAWLGTYYHVALYNEALSPDLINSRFEAGSP
ncbi:MAG: LamG domain-containing protein [Chloroflexi bacterium]|nr:LamG domain-containing protein [Chloroflexota bacterium]